jgi:predicted nucleotidyltransferase
MRYLIGQRRIGKDKFSIKVDLVSKKALKPYIGKYILEEVVYI